MLPQRLNKKDVPVVNNAYLSIKIIPHYTLNWRKREEALLQSIK
jgi:hypothetical protein